MRTPVTVVVSGVTNTTTPVLLESRVVPPGEAWELDFAAFYNQSGESVTQQWAIEWGTTLVLTSADNTVADGKAVSTDILPILVEGESLVAQAVGAAKQGPITMVFSGWRYRLEDSGAV